MADIATERTTVQEPIIRYAGEIGWDYLPPEEAVTLRRGESGTLCHQTLRDKLIDLNSGIVTKDSVDEIISRIENVRNNIEGNAETLAWLKGERSIYVENEKRQCNVTVIDFETPSNNVFQVTDEWSYTNGLHSWERKTNRPDVIFLINGIPVAIIETKSAKKEEGIAEGIVQLRRYHDETPEMMTAPQVFNVTHLIDFYYGVTWNISRKNIFNWKEEEKGNFEKKVKRFFARERFLKLLQNWIIFFKKDDELNKIILRQHQTRAVEKVVERTLDPEKKTGLIWHTQGSGKTFTMITAAEQILTHPAFGKPTVIMLIDRNELEGQLAGWIHSIFGEGKAEFAQSKQHLKELLRADYRGLIVSMIHKFDGVDADLCTRNNVFVLVDEAHRTTSGNLGNYLVGALPNATMIGFTGTPIDKIAYGKGTFKIFGKDDPTGYLDKYSIAESIEDGTTLPLHYTLAPNNILVPSGQLEKEFLDLAEAEGISDIEELNEILNRAVKLKTFLKSSDRIQAVAQFVADHFTKNVEPLGYKAFLVGVDREACALYKQALDKYLPSEYSTVVYSPFHNDPPLLSKFKLSEDQEIKVRKAFVKKDTLPKILIVTEKLLTGFDAPILYCMYLDKPMRDHTLLQAIARVNRPYEDGAGRKKPSGFVVDFVGIFEKLEKALAFDSDVVGSVIKNIDVLKERFATLMKMQVVDYLKLMDGPINDKSVEHAIEYFSDKSKRQTFFKIFKEIEMLYEIISPDPFLRPYLEHYTNLSALYEIIRNAFSKKPVLSFDLMKKTEQLVKERVDITGLEAILPIYNIDENTLKAIKKDPSSDKIKIINLSKSLAKKIQDEIKEKPYLQSIGERVNEVLEQYDDRQISTQTALDEVERLVDEYNSAAKELADKLFGVNAFSILWVLKPYNLEDADVLAQHLDMLFQTYPNAKVNPEEMRLLKAEFYHTLLPLMGKDKLVEVAEKLLNLERK